MHRSRHTDNNDVSSTNPHRVLSSRKTILFSACAVFLIVLAALISVNLSSTHQAHAAAATQTDNTFTQKTISLNHSQAQISFTPNGWTANYVIVHFLFADSGPQNVKMTYNSDSGSWQYTINGLSLETVIYYSFTYQRDGVQYDSGQYTYTF